MMVVVLVSVEVLATCHMRERLGCWPFGMVNRGVNVPRSLPQSPFCLLQPEARAAP